MNDVTMFVVLWLVVGAWAAVLSSPRTPTVLPVARAYRRVMFNVFVALGLLSLGWVMINIINTVVLEHYVRRAAKDAEETRK